MLIRNFLYATRQLSHVSCTFKTLAVARQQLHVSAANAARTFVDFENRYAHDVLVRSHKPYQIFQQTSNETTTVASLTTGMSPPTGVLQPKIGATVNEMCVEFQRLVEYCVRTGTQIDDGRFERFIACFCDMTHELSDSQLLETLRQIAQLPTVESTKVANYMELWNTLDLECCQRIEDWNSEQLLLVCDAWFVLGLARIGEFVWQALRKLGRKVRKMPPEQLVQSMFLCNVMRRPIFEMFDFEVNLARCADEMTIGELGVMAMGFFKTQTPIRNPELIEKLYARLQAELDTVPDITLVSILKVLRYSSKIPHANAMMDLLKALCTQVERISLLACLHVALLGCELQTCHDELIERVLLRFERELHVARLKDIERICLVMALFQTRSANGVEQRILNELPKILHTRIDEILKHPRCFTNCLHFLTLLNQYDTELLEAALEPRFIAHAYKSGLPGREYFHLDSFIKLNLMANATTETAYTGRQLSDKVRRTMGKLYTQYIPERNSKFKLNNTDRVLVDIKECASTLLRELSLKHILPNYERSDLVICYDKQQRRALRIDDDCPEDYSGVILTRQHLLGEQHVAPHIDTVAIVIAGWNNVVRDKDRHTGLFDMKLKQLQILGHKPVVIYWHEWRELETPKDRQNFLRRRLASHINL